MSLAALIMPDALPDPTMPAPASVQVIEALHQPATYRLRYQFNSADGDFPLLKDSHLEPEKDLAVMVMVGMMPKFLVFGPVIRHEIEILNGGAGSTLDVVGGDLCIAMDREDKAKVWSNVTDSLAVLSVLSDGAYRLVPDLGTTNTFHSDLTRPLVQRETGGQLGQLGTDHGFVFAIGHARTSATRGTAGALHLEREPRGPGAHHRVLNHRGSLRRGAQPDTRQGQSGLARDDHRRPGIVGGNNWEQTTIRGHIPEGENRTVQN